jgi:hypothetical protein
VHRGDGLDPLSEFRLLFGRKYPCSGQCASGLNDSRQRMRAQAAEPEIPTHAQDDDFGFEMPSPEQCRPVPPHARASLADRLPAFATHPSTKLLISTKSLQARAGSQGGKRIAESVIRSSVPFEILHGVRLGVRSVWDSRAPASVEARVDRSQSSPR